MKRDVGVEREFALCNSSFEGMRSFEGFDEHDLLFYFHHDEILRRNYVPVFDLYQDEEFSWKNFRRFLHRKNLNNIGNLRL